MSAVKGDVGAKVHAVRPLQGRGSAQQTTKQQQGRAAVAKSLVGSARRAEGSCAAAKADPRVTGRP